MTPELDSEAGDDKSTSLGGKGPFLKTYREIHEIDCVSDSAAPPKSKTMSEMKYLDTKASQEFFDFFFKKYFFAIFPQIFDTSKSKISRSG